MTARQLTFIMEAGYPSHASPRNQTYWTISGRGLRLMSDRSRGLPRFFPENSAVPRNLRNNLGHFRDSATNHGP